MYPLTVPATTERFSYRNDLTPAPEVETGNHYSSRHWEEFYISLQRETAITPK